MSTPLRIGIIGCGAIAETHAECLSQIDGACLAAFCDAERARAEQFARKFPESYASENPEKLFVDDSIDAVYICTHHDSHSTLAVRAATAGKHVMMEKPLALTLSECERVGNAVEKSGITLMVGFKMRYYPSVARARQFIPHPLVSVAQMMDSRWPDDFWANDPVKGGGNVLSQGGHSVDLLYYLNQSEPVRVYAEGGNFTHPGLKIVDNIVATLQFANGSLASLVQGDSGATPFVSKFSFQLLGGAKTAHLRNRLKTVTLFDGADVSVYEDPDEYGFLEENRDFVNSVKLGQPPPITYRDGMRATLVLLKALESLHTGKPEAISF
jgi:predicted dehydrogenase